MVFDPALVAFCAMCRDSTVHVVQCEIWCQLCVARRCQHACLMCSMLVLQTQASNKAAQAKEAFYQKALQDLTLFKSKTNAALLQVCCTATCSQFAGARHRNVTPTECV